MNSDFSRYACQIALPEFGISVQQKLKDSKVLIVGLGGLGCPASQYLTATGVGTIGLADYDIVSISNLHRQILFNDSDIGLPKTIIAAKKLSIQNQNICFKEHKIKVDEENVQELIKDYDIIIDATDNFETRYLLNDACVLNHKPIVYGAIYQYDGQMALWNIKNEDGTFSPNYRDLFPEVNASQIPNCAEGGVIPTIAGIVGCLQANAAINYLAGQSNTLAGNLFIFNAKTLQSRNIHIGKVSKVKIDRIQTSQKIAVIAADNLKKEKNRNAYELIDVRSKKERDEFNIGGIHIPIDTLEKEIENIHFNKPIVFYCSTGKRSAIAARIIQTKFSALKVFSLEGGLEKWNTPCPPKGET